MGIEATFALGLMGGLLCFIPFVGAVLAAIPATLVALTQGPAYAASVILMYVGVHLIEGNFMTPMVQAEATSLPPVLAILSTVAFSLLFGPLGVLLAAPLTLLAFSTVATVIQLALLLLTITRSTFVLMAPALAAGATAAAIYGIAFALRGVAPDGAQQSNRDGLSASEPPSASLHDGRHAGRRCDLEGLAWRRRSCNWDGRRWICRHAFRGDFGRLAGSVCG